MSSRIAGHLRSNVYGLIAIFIALSGTALAVDGPLPGQNQVGSDDIINLEVKRDDLGSDAVRTGKVLDGTLTGDDIAGSSLTGADVASETLTGTEVAGLTGADILNQSLSGSDIQDNSINADDVFGLRGNDDIADGSLTGADIDEGTLDLDLDQVTARSEYSSVRDKHVRVTCPAGKYPIDVGWGIGFEPDHVAIASAGIVLVSREAFIRAREVGSGTTHSWDVTVRAICARLAG